LCKGQQNGFDQQVDAWGRKALRPWPSPLLRMT
jgi:hypothetical protein